MKIEIYEEEPVEEKIRLKLQYCPGGIELCAVDSNGTRLSQGTLLVITKDEWKLLLAKDVNPDLGFPLDKNGQLQILPF